MDFTLGDEEALVAATLRRFASERLAVWSAEADRMAEAPDALAGAAGEVGFFADAVPEAHGGLLDGDYSHLLRAVRGIELGRGCAGLAALLESNVEPALAIGTWGSTELAAELLPRFAEGETAALARDFAGRLALTGGEDLRVDGTLGPIPAAADAIALLCLARDADGEPVVFCAPRAAARVESLTPSGWRAARWATWSFDGASITTGQVLARGRGAASIATAILSWARVSLAARAVGVAAAAMAHAAVYAEERVQFGQPIGRFESLIRLRDRNETAIAAARLLVLEAAWQVDRGAAGAAEAASRARDLAADTVSRATIDAVQIYGGYGFVNDYPVEKLMRDARAFDALYGNESFSRVLDLRGGEEESHGHLS